MGNCKFCGGPAGFLRSKHSECDEKHRQACRDIAATISQRVFSTEPFDALLPQLRSIAKPGYVTDGEIQHLLVEQWVAAVDRGLEDGVLDDSEETRLVQFKDTLSLPQAELDRSGALTKLVKGGVLRAVMHGVIRQRVALEGNLAINFQKSEQVVWAFPNADYYEDKTRRQYVGSSQGISIRIAKGVYYRTGAFKGHPVDRTERVRIDSGVLVVTSKNIYFSGPSKSVRIPYAKILSFQPFDDGIGINRDAASARPQIFVTGDGWFTYNLVVNLAKL